MTVRARSDGPALALTLAVCLLGGEHAAAQETVTFRLDLEAGHELEFRTTTTQDLTVTPGEEPIETEEYARVRRTLSVLDRTADGSMRVESRFEAAQGWADSPRGREYDYDSADILSNPPPTMRGIHAMLDVPIRFTLEPDGTASAFERLDEVVDSVVTDLASLPIGAPRPEVLELIRDQVTEPGVAEVFHAATAFFPERPVRPGDTWPLESDVTGPSGRLVLSGTWRFAEMTDGLAIIEGEADVLEGSNIERRTENATVISAFTGTQTTRVEVDPATGWIVYLRTDQDVTGTTTVYSRTRTPVAMPLSMTTTSWIEAIGR